MFAYTCVVKRALVVFLTLAFMFSNTGFNQMLKLPVLLVHFGEHKKEKPQMSFAEFLHLHYVHGNVMDKDYEKDMQLPFKTVDFSFANLNIYHNLPHFEVKAPVLFTSSLVSIYHIFFISSSLLNNIWQPPKF